MKSRHGHRKGAPNALARDRKDLSMEELIGRITDAVGIDEQTAQTAIGVILGFLNKEGPDDAMSRLVDAIPGADALSPVLARVAARPVVAWPVHWVA